MLKKIGLFILFLLLIWLVASFLMGCNIRPGFVSDPVSVKCKCLGIVIDPAAIRRKRTGETIYDNTEIDYCLGFITQRKSTSGW